MSQREHGGGGKPSQLKKDRKGSRYSTSEDHGGVGRTGQELGVTKCLAQCMVDGSC